MSWNVGFIYNPIIMTAMDGEMHKKQHFHYLSISLLFFGEIVPCLTVLVTVVLLPKVIF